MKSIGIYILLSFVSLFFVIQIALLLVAVKPSLFTSTNNSSPTDTLSTLSEVQNDSPNQQNVDSSANLIKPENQLTTQNVDSTHSLKQELGNQQKQYEEINLKLPETTKISDSTREASNKTKIKLLESMSADNAARIIQQMENDEARILLKTMKKRQAAKILSSLEPEKAIELMR